MREYLTLKNLINILLFTQAMIMYVLNNHDLTSETVQTLSFVLFGIGYWVNTNKGERNGKR